MDNDQNNAVWNGIAVLDRGYVVSTPQGTGYYMGTSYEGEEYCKVVIDRITLDILVSDLSSPSSEEVEQLLLVQQEI